MSRHSKRMADAWSNYDRAQSAATEKKLNDLLAKRGQKPDFYLSKFEEKCRNIRHDWQHKAVDATHGPDTLEIEILGHISREIAARVARQLDSAPNASTAHVHINSTGGSIVASEEIYAQLAGFPARIVCHAREFCQSAALLIFLACDVRYATADCKFLSHKASYAASITPEIQAQLDGYDRIENLVALDRAGIDFETMNGWRERGNRGETFCAKEAFAFGLIHDIREFEAPRARVKKPKAAKRNALASDQPWWVGSFPFEPRPGARFVIY